MVDMNAPPNDVRNFVHKRLFKAAKGFVTSGFNPLSAVSGFLAPTTSTVRPVRPRFGRQISTSRPVSRAVVRRPTARTITARPGPQSAAEKARGREVKFASVPSVMPRIGREFSSGAREFFGGDSSCIVPGMKRNADGDCSFFLGDQEGRDDTPIGDTVMGQYGAGEVPGNHVINRAVCRRGMVLGSDGVCYNRTQISNKERAWPRGRRPLLTGGDMRAISTAARAGKRLEGATKRLQKIGLMKKPASRRVSQAQAHHALKP